MPPWAADAGRTADQELTKHLGDSRPCASVAERVALEASIAKLRATLATHDDGGDQEVADHQTDNSAQALAGVAIRAVEVEVWH